MAMNSRRFLSPLTLFPLASVALLGYQAGTTGSTAHSLPDNSIAPPTPPPLREVRPAFDLAPWPKGSGYALQGTLVDASGLPLDTPLDIRVEVSPRSRHSLEGMSWGGEFHLTFRPNSRDRTEQEITVHLVVQDAHGLGKQRFEDVTLSSTTPFDLGELYLEPMWLAYPEPLLEGTLRDSLGNVPLGARARLIHPRGFVHSWEQFNHPSPGAPDWPEGLVDLGADGTFRVFGPPEAADLHLMFGAPNHEILRVRDWSHLADSADLTLGRQFLAKGQLNLPADFSDRELGAFTSNVAGEIRRGLTLDESGQFSALLSQDHNRIELREKGAPLPAFEHVVDPSNGKRIYLEPFKVDGQIFQLSLPVTFDGEPAAGLKLTAARSADGRFLGGWNTDEASRLDALVWRGLETIWVKTPESEPTRLDLAALPQTLELTPKQSR